MKKIDLTQCIIFIFLALFLTHSGAQATQLEYRPMLSTLQRGNPVNGPTQLAIAEAQKPKDKSAAASNLQQRSLEDLIFTGTTSALQQKINEKLLCSGAACPNVSEEIQVGRGSVRYTRTADLLIVTLVDEFGGTTEIKIPRF